MDIKSLQLFVFLSESLHFGHTALRCNLSPSAVSRQLQRLEDSVGQLLVDRNNRHVRLTSAGEVFLTYARKAIYDWQQMQSLLRETQTQISGELSVFGSVTASYSILTQILPKLRESSPGLDVKLRTGDQADGIERVLSGDEDCAIIARPDQLPSKLTFLPLLGTPLRLIGPTTPGAFSDMIEKCVAEKHEPNWSKTPMILAERGLARKRLLKYFSDNDGQPNIYAQVAGHEAVVSMVSLGFGLAVVPELVIQHSPKQETVRVLPWLNELPPFVLGLCALQEQLKDPLLQAFWKCSLESYPNQLKPERVLNGQ